MKEITQAEYLKKIEDIIKECEEKKKKLSMEYVTKNKKYKVGDIIQSKNTKITIKVESIGWGFEFGSNVPEAVYHGSELTKALEPKKNGHKHKIWESNVKK